jgi:hypothetical protein
VVTVLVDVKLARISQSVLAVLEWFSAADAPSSPSTSTRHRALRGTYAPDA